MGFNAAATVIPGKGTVLTAAPDTAPPVNWETLNPLTIPESDPWDAMGHTSRSNNVALSKEGGESTQIGSWWDPALRSNYADTTWNITINSIQIDKMTLELAFGGGDHDAAAGSYSVAGSVTPAEKALFILIVDASRRMGIYIPNTTITIGDAPEISAEDFFEIQLAAAMLNSPTTGERFRFFHPALKAS